MKFCLCLLGITPPVPTSNCWPGSSSLIWDQPKSYSRLDTTGPNRWKYSFCPFCPLFGTLSSDLYSYYPPWYQSRCSTNCQYSVSKIRNIAPNISYYSSEYEDSFNPIEYKLYSHFFFFRPETPEWPMHWPRSTQTSFKRGEQSLCFNITMLLRGRRNR